MALASASALALASASSLALASASSLALASASSLAEPVLGSLLKERFGGGVDRLSKRVDGCAFVDVEVLGFSAPFFIFPVI